MDTGPTLLAGAIVLPSKEMLIDGVCVQTEELKKHGLFVNRALGIVACALCNANFRGVSAIKKHIRTSNHKKMHPYLKEKESNDFVDKTFERDFPQVCGEEAPPYAYKDNQPPIAGLRLLEGFFCIICAGTDDHYACPAIKTMKNHYLHHHLLVRQTFDAVLSSCHVQKKYKKNHFVRVNVTGGELLDATIDVGSRLLSLLDVLPGTRHVQSIAPGPLDDRNSNKLYQKLGFNVIANEIGPEHLKKIHESVHRGDDERREIVKTAFLELAESISLAIGGTNNRVLFKLQNSVVLQTFDSPFGDDDEELSGGSYKYFRVVKHVEKYANTAATFVMMLLYFHEQGETPFKVPQLEDIETHLVQIKSTLDARSSRESAVGMQDLVRHMSDILTSLMKHKFSRTDPFTKSIMSWFFFARHLKLDSRHDRIHYGQTTLMTQPVAHLMYFMKGVVLLELKRIDGLEIADRAAAQDPFTWIGAETATHFVSTFMFLVDFLKTVRHFIADDGSRKYEITVGIDQFGNSNPHVMHINGVTITLEKFLIGVRNLRDKLFEAIDLLLLEFKCEDPLASIEDDLKCETPGYGFHLSLKKSNTAYFKHICNRFLKVDKDGNVVFKDYARTIEFLRRCDDAVELLFVAVHIFGGPPLRTTEISPLLLSNRLLDTGEAILRHVFYMDQLKAFAIFSKYGKSGRETIRFLLDDIAVYFAKYTAIIKPATGILAHITEKLPPNVNATEDEKREHEEEMHARFHSSGFFDYLFVYTFQRHMSDAKLREIFPKITQSIFGVRLTIGMNRQLIAYIVNDLTGLHNPEVMQKMVESAAATPHEQSGHTLKSAARYYGKSNKELTTSNPYKVRTTHTWVVQWVNFLLGRHAPPPSEIPAGMVAPRPGLTVPNAFHGNSTASTNPSSSTDREVVMIHVRKGESRVYNSSTNPDLTATADDAALSLLLAYKAYGLDGTVTFRSDSQRIVMQLIPKLAESPEDVLLILPTNSGKSLLVESAANYYICNPPSSTHLVTTILVVPILSLGWLTLDRLKERYAARTDKLNAYFVYGETVDVSCETLSRYHIVVVTPEGAARASESLKLMSVTRRLGTIVFDEVQAVLGHFTFRQSIIDLLTLSKKFENSSRIFMTGSFPVSMETVFRFLLDSRTELKIYRFDTRRENIHHFRIRMNEEVQNPYLVEKRCENLEMHYVFEICTIVRESDVPARTVIVYVSSQAETETYKRLLQSSLSGTEDIGDYYIEAFHGGLPTDKKQEICTKWERITGFGVLICTSAWGMGLDHDVVCVIFAGIPRSLVDYVQGAGRGGRRPNTIAFSVLLSTETLTEKRHDYYSKDIQEAKMQHHLSNTIANYNLTELSAMRNFALSDSKCAVQSLTPFMEGDSVHNDTCIGSRAACDSCIRYIPEDVRLIYRKEIPDSYEALLLRLLKFFDIKAHSLAPANRMITYTRESTGLERIHEVARRDDHKKLADEAALTAEHESAILELVGELIPSCVVCAAFSGKFVKNCQSIMSNRVENCTSLRLTDNVREACFVCLRRKHVGSGCTYVFARVEYVDHCAGCTLPSKFHKGRFGMDCENSKADLKRLISLALMAKEVEQSVWRKFPDLSGKTCDTEEFRKWASTPSNHMRGLLNIHELLVFIWTLIKDVGALYFASLSTSLGRKKSTYSAAFGSSEDESPGHPPSSRSEHSLEPTSPVEPNGECVSSMSTEIADKSASYTEIDTMAFRVTPTLAPISSRAVEIENDQAQLLRQKEIEMELLRQKETEPLHEIDIGRQKLVSRLKEICLGLWKSCTYCTQRFGEFAETCPGRSDMLNCIKKPKSRTCFLCTREGHTSKECNYVFQKVLFRQCCMYCTLPSMMYGSDIELHNHSVLGIPVSSTTVCPFQRIEIKRFISMALVDKRLRSLVCTEFNLTPSIDVNSDQFKAWIASESAELRGVTNVNILTVFIWDTIKGVGTFNLHKRFPSGKSTEPSTKRKRS